MFDFFRQIFNPPPGRNPKNAPGDFYVQRDVCILCGAPEAEAPDLIIMDDNGCYFKKQPETNEEIDRAINAIRVSCISAVRYGGKDQKILDKLHHFGCQSECDNPLKT